MLQVTKPSPEVRELIKSWCKIQEEKYGPDWKKSLVKEMAAQTIEKLPPEILRRLLK